MSNQNDSLSESVSDLLPSLAATAVNLNEASKKLSAVIERIDDALQRLNLGVTTWVKVRRGDDHARGGMYFWSEDLGYSRISRKWGLTLKREEGHEGLPESIKEEEWPFNDAPRSLRIMALRKIPELIKELDREAKEVAEQISASINETVPLVEAIEISARPQRSIKKKLGGRL